MSDPEVPARPTAPAPEHWWERVQRWRSDPRAGAALLALVAIAGVVVWLRASAGPPPSPATASATATGVTTASRSATTTSTASLLVHVVGAVRASGVVELAPGSRVRDAVAAAGGPADDADLQQMNLAAPIADGQRIAVPRIGEPAPVPAAPNAPQDAAADGSTPAGPLNLNTATATELEALPGIGPTLADAIVREREKLGGFKTVDDLKQVRGIGDARFADIRDLVTV